MICKCPEADQDVKYLFKKQREVSIAKGLERAQREHGMSLKRQREKSCWNLWAALKIFCHTGVIVETHVFEAEK